MSLKLSKYLIFIFPQSAGIAFSPACSSTSTANEPEIINGNDDNGSEAYGYSLPLRHNGAEEYGGPFFWAHYSYLGLNPRNLEYQYANPDISH